jgi:hypothetical protein
MPVLRAGGKYHERRNSHRRIGLCQSRPVGVPGSAGQKKSFKSAAHSNGARWGATRDATQIRYDWSRWPFANVAIVTGPTSGVFVVEIDTPQGHNVDGFATLARLEAEHGPLPPTRQAQSPSGSLHYYWRMPSGVIIRNDVGTRLGPGIDIRGEGGMVIAPPSRRSDGKYIWLNELPVANAPHWLLARIVERSRPLRRLERAERSADPIQRKWVELLLSTINPDLPYPAWFAIGCALFTVFGDELGEAIWREWSAQGRKYKVGEIARKWRGIVEHDGYNHTVASIYHFTNWVTIDAKLIADNAAANCGEQS